MQMKTKFYDKRIKAKRFRNRLPFHWKIALTLVLIATAFFCRPVQAQEAPNPADRALRSNFTVNPSTLALELNLPLGAYPGRGGSVPVTLSYSSKVWKMSDAGNAGLASSSVNHWANPNYAEKSASGWTMSLAVPTMEDISTYRKYTSIGGGPTPQGGYILPRVLITMPDGSSHEMRYTDTQQTSNSSTQPNLNQIYYSVDGSGMKLDLQSSTPVLYLPDGSRYIGIGSSSSSVTYVDAEGNTIVYNNGSTTDTMGRSLSTQFVTALSQTAPYGQPTVGDQSYSLPGLGSSSLSYTFKWRQLKNTSTNESVLTDSSQALRYIADYTNCDLNTASNQSPHLFPVNSNGLGLVCDDGVWGLFNPVVLSEIVLPNGSKYSFTYNVYGEIEKVIYPTGGYERFEYDQINAVGYMRPDFAQANRGVVKRWVSIDGVNEQTPWQYFAGYSNPTSYTPPYIVTTLAPNGTKTERYLHSSWQQQPFDLGDGRDGMVYEEKVFDSNNALLRRTLNDWAAVGGYNGYPRGARLTKTIDIAKEAGASSALAKTTAFTYDNYGNRTLSNEYDYAAIDATTAASGTLSSISSGALLRTSETDYLTDSNYIARWLTGLPTETRIKDSTGTVQAKSQVFYDESGYSIISAGTDSTWTNPNTNYRGNPTTSRSWTDISNNQYIETHAQYDNFGNLRKAWDARGNLSETEYTSTYKYTYPTKITTPIPDSTGANGSSTTFETSSTYDLTTGLPITTTDANGQVTTMEYNDNLLRPTKVIPPSAGGQTVIEYTDTPNAVSVKTKSQIDTTNWTESITYADGLGRTTKLEKKDNAGNIFIETEYDLMGRVERTTNPYRAGDAKLWTTSTYDDLSRIIKVKTPDNAEMTTAFDVSTSSNYVGLVKTITDQAGKKRSGVMDALGRMIHVIEDPAGQNLSTFYKFDTLDNLREMIQGNQHRYFMYDALSRLLRSKQPEQDVNSSLTITDPFTNNSNWAVAYAYDNNGNITSTTDARGITIAGTYDKLNRLTLRDYSDSTPDVSFYYDGTGLSGTSSYAKGKMTKVSSNASETKYQTFDNLGRIKSSQQTTNGQTYYFSDYGYDLAGNLISQVYPSGRIITSQIAPDGSLASINGQLNSVSKIYASSIAYTAASAVKELQLGNGRWETAKFNNRLQITEIGLGTSSSAQDVLKLEYDYSLTNNNGSLQSQKITVPTIGSSVGFTATQIYDYDSLNRLNSAIETISNSQIWKQAFNYDRYGNRRFDASNTTTIQSGCSTAVCNPTIDTANNRFTTGQSYSYDSAGNLTLDAEGRQFVYDAENRQKTFGTNNSSTNGGEYFYDGEGKRVRKVSGQIETIFVYNAAGQLIAEYETSSATPANTTQYLTQDALGSPRVITDQSGNVLSRRDYAAFGDEIYSSQRTLGLGYAPSNTTQQYTGYQRDEESGLDYAQARYYNSNHGRFTSVDPLTASATIRNPQTFNRYSYGLNSPYKFTDPIGLAAEDSAECTNKYLKCNKNPKREMREAAATQRRVSELREMMNAQSAAQSGDIDMMLEAVDNMESSQVSSIPRRGYYIEYEIGKEIIFNGEIPTSGAQGGVPNQPLYGAVRNNTILVYKDGKLVTANNVTVEEQVKNISVTTTESTGRRTQAPQEIRDELNRGSLETNGLRNPVYDPSNGKRPLDRQGILMTSRDDYDFYKVLNVTSTDRITFTVRVGNKVVATRTVTSIKTVTSVKITKGPNRAY